MLFPIERGVSNGLNNLLSISIYLTYSFGTRSPGHSGVHLRPYGGFCNRHGVSNNRPLDYLFNSLFRMTAKIGPKCRIAGLLLGESPCDKWIRLSISQYCGMRFHAATTPLYCFVTNVSMWLTLRWTQYFASHFVGNYRENNFNVPTALFVMRMFYFMGIFNDR